jgi:hypothetical protein
MSKETIEKKLYPSQINTKTISARIPVQDYVKFLQESLKDNITLNDWLLIKIYNNDSIGKHLDFDDIKNNNNKVIRIYKYDLNSKQEWAFYKEEFGEKDYIDMDKEFIANLMNNLMHHWEMVYEPKVASLQDVKTQLTVLIKGKFEDIQDQKAYRKEVFELLKELE